MYIDPNSINLLYQTSSYLVHIRFYLFYITITSFYLLTHFDIT